MVNPRIPHLKWHRTPQLSSEKWSIHYASLSALYNPLYTSISNQDLFEKHLCNPHILEEMVPRAPVISIIVWKVKYPLRFVVSYVQPVTQQYESRTVWKASLLSKSPLWQIRMISVTRKGNHHVLSPNQHFLLSAKMNGTQRRTLVNPWRMHCTYCGMPKGTCQAKTTSNSENIKLVALAVIELRLSEGISQLVSQSLENFNK